MFIIGRWYNKYNFDFMRPSFSVQSVPQTRKFKFVRQILQLTYFLSAET